MDKNIIITGPTGTGKSTVVASYWADNWTSTILLDGIELAEKAQIPTEEDIAKLKQCHILILDNVLSLILYPTTILSSEIIQDILEHRFTFGKTMVIVEQNIPILGRLKMEIVNKILKHSNHIQLRTLSDSNAALLKLKSILGEKRENRLIGTGN